LSQAVSPYGAGLRSRSWLLVKPLEQDRKLLADPAERWPRSVNPEPMPAILIADYAFAC
jgi:hypothetical protein